MEGIGWLGGKGERGGERGKWGEKGKGEGDRSTSRTFMGIRSTVCTPKEKTGGKWHVFAYISHIEEETKIIIPN